MTSITRGLIIGGREIPASSGRTTPDIGPWTGTPYAQVAAGTPEDVTRAIDAADAAADDWAALAPTRRRAIFLRAADLLESRTPEAVALMADEVGGAAPWAGFNAALAAGILREAAAAITQPTGQILATDTPGAYSMHVRVPVGVVAAIAPWNAPLILGIRAIAMPLAMGNTVVLKPSEDAPLACGLFLADILHEAGLPAGVLNVVTNDLADAPQIVATLIADPRVRLVNFTGSTAVGRRVGVLAAEHLKPAVLELGGKNALLVLADADVDYAVDAAAFGSFMNSGQICMSADRVVVHRDRAEEFTRKLAAKIKSLRYGDPSDPATVVGPVVSARAARRVAALVQDATDKGAQLLAGTGRVEGDAEALLAPVVLTGVTEDMDIYYGEIFGPATVVHVVDSVDEAVDLANDTPYGLTAGVITEDFAAGVAVARRLRTGIVHVNNQTVADEPQAPFGGVKDSGYGRFGGQAGIDAFTTARWITVQAHGHAHFPF
ncbi:MULTISPECIES: aldehyde dehydrogenase family protein [Streptomyces]|uniref:Salicylaldehyde dehydrogenase n=2 Tax=Streptomyces TaxID=1883 RepID=A0A0W7WVJ7_9ACTN|nr:MULTISPECIES: aldehyde dehydrogenase family protein [Streptomyces]KUF14625.1 salicylaldehyde dehydrogenase [Streptomyces silvensis]MVO87694.1 aldehyde dehydrogenase family protein [Streptomyces typhae]